MCRWQSGTGAHPHTRGDDVAPRRAAAHDQGSPPHAWGRPHGPTGLGNALGSPPHAWGRQAGDDPAWDLHSRINTPHAWGRQGAVAEERRRREASPPTRVETTTPDPASSTVGSPPHAWGRPYTSVSATHAGARLTPTRVGTTTAPWHERRPVHRAHPHTRGDDMSGYGPQSRQRRGIGSPPHTRGDDVHRHPGAENPWQSGSPPHAWGRQQPGLRGASRAMREPPPHAWGRQTSVSRRGRGPGSPPHAWGRPSTPRQGTTTRGLTPTRVGTTGRTQPRIQSMAPEAHPPTRVGTTA